MDDTEIAMRFPQLAYLLNIPEVGDLVRQRANGQIDLAEYQGRVAKTNWWLTSSDNTRKWQILQSYDPRTAQESIREREAQIWDLVQSLGAGGQLGVPEVQKIAEESLRLGLQGPQLQDRIVSQIRYTKEIGSTPGSVATTINGLRKMASGYMVRPNEEVLFDFSRKIAAGELQAEDVDVYFREQAKGKFPNLADYIDRGITPENFFAQHKSEVAKMLEMSDDQVNFMDDPKWSQILDHTDEKGNRGPMTISETQRYVRGMDEWRSTRQGQQIAAEGASFLTKTFGKTA